MEQVQFTTNISGKVRNTRLPKSKALWPLFEVISNSIHAIEEKGNPDGKIDITVIRNGKPEILLEQPQIDVYPINSFIVEDNGVGFTKENYKSFLTAESEYKIAKGAKGIGRFVCLKAFKAVIVKSFYQDEGQKKIRSFEFKNLGNGIHKYKNEETEIEETGTTVKLHEYRDDFQNYCPLTLVELAQRIVEHFLIYFLLDKVPEITLYEISRESLNVRQLYKDEIKTTIESKDFKIKLEEFQLHALKLYSSRVRNHTLHYCANEREVSSESIEKHIHDLGKRLKDEQGEIFSYQIYITSDYLDRNVDTERTGFDIPKGDEIVFNDVVVTKKDLTEGVVFQIEEVLSDILSQIRESKFEKYRDHILDQAPEYKPLLKHKPEAINGIVPGLKGTRLDIELMKAQTQLDVEVKELGEEILTNKDDITNLEEYKEKYEDFIEKFNDLGKSKLAKYIVHRKAVIELLDEFIGERENGEFMKEDAIHSIFFPIKTESDQISFDKQNLWLIDERLAYHEYLASDKSFKQNKVVANESSDRADLLIFNNSFAFVEDDAPHQSFVIVEFKRPERADYSDRDEKKNPIDQVVSYIRTIRESKAVDRRGKEIEVNKERTPFYAYIICDFNSSLKQILENRNYKQTPDGMGHFYFHESYNAYIEVISYNKLLKDAKKKNRILFEKLGLPL